MEMCSVCELSCSYTMYGKIPALVAKYGGSIDESDFTDDVSLRFQLPEDHFAAFNKSLSEESSGKYAAREISKDFFEKNP